MRDGPLPDISAIAPVRVHSRLKSSVAIVDFVEDEPLGGWCGRWGRAMRRAVIHSLSYRRISVIFFSTNMSAHRKLRCLVAAKVWASSLFEAFVIAFIHCAGQGCVISYPRPQLAYLSYDKCEAQLQTALASKELESAGSTGSEVACVEVPGRYIADEWMTIEATNLRSGPFAEASVIGTIKRGTTFRAFAQERNWLCIETADGVVGFVWSERAKKIHSGSMTPEMRSLSSCTSPGDRPHPSGAELAQSQGSTEHRPVTHQARSSATGN